MRKAFWFSVFILTLLYLFSRLYNLALLPIFFDEANYVLWAKMIAETNKHWFIPLAAAKSLSLIWLIVPAVKVFPAEDYLTAGRMIPVLVGLFGLIGIYKLSVLLFKSRRLGLLAGFLYVLCPFILFYERLALYDSLLSVFLIWSVYYCLKTANYFNFWDAFFWGVALGLAFLTKATAVIFWFLTPAIFLVRAKIGRTSKWKFIILISVALGIAQVLNHSVIISSGYHLYFKNSLDYTPSFSELLKNPTEPLLTNLALTFNWSVSYLSVPFLIISFWGWILILKKNFRIGILFGFMIAVPIVGLSFFGRIYFPRYILFTIPYFLIPIAFFLNYIYARLKPQAFLVIIFFALINFQNIKFDLLLLTNPPALISILPKIESSQYISGFPSGYGLDDAFSKIDQIIKEKNITLVVQADYYGHLWSASRLKYFGKKNPHLIRRWPETNSDWEITKLLKSEDVYLLFASNSLSFGVDNTINIPAMEMARFQKPGGKEYIALFKLEP